MASIILITVIAVAAYQIKEDNQQSTLNNFSDPQNQTNYNNGTPNTINQGGSNSLNDNEDTNNQNTSTAQKTSSKDDVNNYDSRSIASKYIEEPNAVAGKPIRVKIGGRSTDVVPVLLDNEQVGEIHIDPQTGENVGGAGGAP